MGVCCHSSCRDVILLPGNMLPLLSVTEGDETGVMDSLMEALQSGAAFRDRRKRTPRNGTVSQTKPDRRDFGFCFPWLVSESPHHPLFFIDPYFILLFVFGETSCLLSGMGSDDLFLLSLFFLCCFIAIVTAGDQSPSSPASRWPGANYGNRTLGACLSGPDALVLHSCWLHNSLICLVKTLQLSWSTTCRVTVIIV